MADFTTRFNELLERAHGNDTDLAAALGVSKQTISAWKNGTRFPKRPTIRSIADHFNVGVPWLEGITDDESAESRPVLLAPVPDLSEQEEELVGIYRDLNALGQQTLMGTARGLAANPDMKRGGASSAGTA